MIKRTMQNSVPMSFNLPRRRDAQAVMHRPSKPLMPPCLPAARLPDLVPPCLDFHCLEIVTEFGGISAKTYFLPA